MSAYGISSDEVAEDYRKALEDLTMNSRYEISNLTVIAKENTEHALAISEALKNHIKRVRIICLLFAFYHRLDLYLVWKNISLIVAHISYDSLTYNLPDCAHKEATCFLCP